VERWQLVAKLASRFKLVAGTPLEFSARTAQLRRIVEAVVGKQKRVEFLDLPIVIHRPGDVGQDTSPLHEAPLSRRSAMGALDRPKNLADDTRRGYAGTG
jgi:hypothetical protein